MRAFFPLRMSQLSNDAIPKTAAIQRLYEWDPLTDFIRLVMGLQALYRIADPFLLPLPSKPSIAVMPFVIVNMSGDPDRDSRRRHHRGHHHRVVAGPDLLVIARNSSFAYKGKSATDGTIAHELGVECVLKGSVRSRSARVRITAQLINATSGSNIWAERYDRELTDIFLVQDDVSLSIVGALAVEAEGVDSRVSAAKASGKFAGL